MIASPSVIRDPAEFSAFCAERRREGKRIGFVPTMGALHEGHLALAHEARRRADVVVVSIFVNPTQFGPHEDLARYPRDLAGDAAKLATVPVDCIFAPDAAAMYVPGEQTRVTVHTMTEPLCGRFRPGHFEGVTTIVTKLFALTGPSTAVFGRKDYQQLAVIRRMTADLFLPVTIVGHPIVREADGLAMSSRNAYLSQEERARALCLSRALRAAHAAFERGERRGAALEALARAEVEKGADRIDYVDVVDSDSLTALRDQADIGSRALVAIACHIGKTRLIDNMVLGEDTVPVAGTTPSRLERPA